MVDLLAALAPTLAQAMRTAAAKAYVILDGTLVAIDRLGGVLNKLYYSGCEYLDVRCESDLTRTLAGLRCLVFDLSARLVAASAAKHKRHGVNLAGHRRPGRAAGVALTCPARELQISEQTYDRWRNQFGGLKVDDAKRLKDLERENSTLRRLLAEALPHALAPLERRDPFGGDQSVGGVVLTGREEV